jgi:cell division protease FtsH
MPPFPDDALLPLLNQQGVTVTAKDTSGGSWVVDLLLNLLPLLLFGGVLYLMTRQARRGQQAIFGFTGSRARKYDPARPGNTFADVAGQDEAKNELKEVVDFLRQPERYERLGARLPRGILLVGPPGTGKTLLARAIAGEAGVPFFSISATEFVELFVGVGAGRVRDLFTNAKAAAPAIIFVDEIDAVGRQRGTGLGGGNDEREQTLNQLLVEMDGFDSQTHVIVLAATNRPDVLDPALLRPGRFDRQVTVSLPDRNGRQAILTLHTKSIPLDQDVQLGSLARRTPGFSGADLANLANEAALAAARRGGATVTRADFEEALDKIVLGTKQSALLSPEERRLVAFHEGGHALVAKLTPGADPVTRVTIIPHGRALGVTEQITEDDRHTYPRSYLINRLTVMLGGRAAEELIFDEPTTGAEQDLKQATALARRMIGLWGMSDEVGPVSYGVGEEHPFLGRELAKPREYAESTAADIDSAVREIIDTAHHKARTLLTEHRTALETLADLLIAQETIDGSKIDELLAGSPAAPGG